MAKAKYTQGKDGYFKTNVWDGTYDEFSRKHYVPLRSKKSSGDLERKVIAHNERIRNRQFVRKSDVTFQAYADAWQKVYKSGLSVSTRKMYDNIITKHFADLQMPVGEITRAHYIYALNKIDGNRTKQQFQLTFRQVVNSAIHDKLLPAAAYDDILSGVATVKYRAPEKRSLTTAEKNAIKKCTFKREADKVFLYLLYYTGMRGEEIRALTVFDINMKKKEISVTKAVVFDDNDPVLKDTKNHVTRTIPMADELCAVLAPYLSAMRNTVLFHRGDKYITKSMYVKMWGRVLKEIERNSEEPVHGLTPHIFRHNYCASLCNKIPEISIKKIAELLGDSEKMVIEVYNHEVAGKEKPHNIVAAALAL